MNVGMITLAVSLWAAVAGAETPSTSFTLYRNSPLDPAMRIHIATFNAAEGTEYNAENCWIVAKLFQQQAGVAAGYWCEPGEYRE